MLQFTNQLDIMHASIIDQWYSSCLGQELLKTSQRKNITRGPINKQAFAKLSLVNKYYYLSLFGELSRVFYNYYIQTWTPFNLVRYHLPFEKGSGTLIETNLKSSYLLM